MSSSDLIEIYPILTGLKRRLLNKEELLQIIKLDNRKELLKRVKSMFHINRELRNKEDIKSYFDYLLNEYLRKIEGFLKIDFPGLNFREILDFKELFSEMSSGLERFNRINENLRRLSKAKWKNSELFYEWFDFLLALYILRLKNNLNFEKHFFRIHSVKTNYVDYEELVEKVFAEDGDPGVLFKRFREPFGKGDLQTVFEGGKYIFYSEILERRMPDFDDLPTYFFMIFLLYMRQTEFILASLNCIELGLSKERLKEMVI